MELKEIHVERKMVEDLTGSELVGWYDYRVTYAEHLYEVNHTEPITEEEKLRIQKHLSKII